MKAIKKNLADKIMLDHRTDLINHLYFMLLEIRKLNVKSKKLDRKIQVMNMYNNRIRSGCTWNGNIRRIRRALKDLSWEPII